MFDIGWTELLVIAAVTIIVVGPKELPGLLRTLGQMVGRVRQISSDFRSQLDEAMQAEEIKNLQKDLDEIKEDVSKDNPMGDLKEKIEDQFNPEMDKILSDAPNNGENGSSVEDAPEEKPVVYDNHDLLPQIHPEIEQVEQKDNALNNEQKVREA
ncbi:MAG: Sec-independent protein translocase protein TatB [Methyloligellaceae bacterium]